jgi:hypothetical protein
LEVPTCENDLTIPDYKLPIETRLVKYLRIWRDSPNAVTSNGRTVEDELAGLLEWYICECIPYGPDSLGGWWSDGVVLLEIHQVEPDIFKLLGVTWIDSLGIAPFEIDVELSPSLDSHFTKTTFRIGVLDDYGNPKILDRRMDVRRVLEMRPRHNQDWAMAVELTPP